MIRKSVARNVLLWLLVSLFAWPACVWAGGGPENLLLVVNRRSQQSLYIANYYAKLRQIPADNIFYLPWDPAADITDVDTFRKQILLPILRLIHQRRLGNQIDAIVYSSDFPWAVKLDADIPKLLEELRQAVARQSNSPAGLDKKK